MQFFGIDKLSFDLHKVSFRKSKKTVVTDESLLPGSCFVTIKKLITLTEIKALINSGGIKEGAEIIENKNLSIK